VIARRHVAVAEKKLDASAIDVLVSCMLCLLTD
jgi:hypothetical protein